MHSALSTQHSALSTQHSALSHKSLLKNLFYSLLFLSFTPPTLFASNFNSPAAVTNAGSAMYTTNDIYNRLNAGTPGTKRDTTFTEPLLAPTSSTHKDLNEVMLIAPEVDDTNGATAAEVLNTKTFWGLRSDGTWGATTGSQTAQSLDPASNTLNAGNYAGTTLSTVDTNLAAENIKTGVTIFGINGSATVATYPVVIPKTGQNLCYKTDGTTGTIPCDSTTGQDGDTNMQKGIAHASPRFTKHVNTANDDGGFANNGGTLDGIASDGLCNGSETCNGTVTDNSTGLIWLTKANCIGTDNTGFDADGRVTWAQAFTFITGINDGTYNCADISETSGAATHQTDWRLPNVKELQSLIDFQYYNPALPDTAGTAQWSDGGAFSSVVSSYYWSSTTYVDSTDYAWVVTSAAAVSSTAIRAITTMSGQ